MAVGVKIEVIKIGSIKSKRRSFDRQFGLGVQNGLVAAGEVLKKASNDIAPIESGALIEESFSTPKPLAGMDTVVHIGYGPPGKESETYAIEQHEMFEIKKRAGRQWKYLETPTRDKKVQADMIRAVTEGVNRKIS